MHAPERFVHTAYPLPDSCIPIASGSRRAFTPTPAPLARCRSPCSAKPSKACVHAHLRARVRCTRVSRARRVQCSRPTLRLPLTPSGCSALWSPVRSSKPALLQPRAASLACWRAEAWRSCTLSSWSHSSSPRYTQATSACRCAASLVTAALQRRRACPGFACLRATRMAAAGCGREPL